MSTEALGLSLEVSSPPLFVVLYEVEGSEERVSVLPQSGASRSEEGLLPTKEVK